MPFLGGGCFRKNIDLAMLCRFCWCVLFVSLLLLVVGLVVVCGWWLLGFFEVRCWLSVVVGLVVVCGWCLLGLLLLVVGRWSLVVGWLFVVCCLLVVGCWLLTTSY